MCPQDHFGVRWRRMPRSVSRPSRPSSAYERAPKHARATRTWGTVAAVSLCAGVVATTILATVTQGLDLADLLPGGDDATVQAAGNDGPDGLVTTTMSPAPRSPLSRRLRPRSRRRRSRRRSRRRVRRRHGRADRRSPAKLRRRRRLLPLRRRPRPAVTRTWTSSTGAAVCSSPSRSPTPGRPRSPTGP